MIDEAAKKSWWSQLETKTKEYSGEIDTALNYVKELNSISMVNHERAGSRFMDNFAQSLPPPTTKHSVIMVERQISSLSIENDLA